MGQNVLKSEKLDDEIKYFPSSKTIKEMCEQSKAFGIPGKSNVTLGGAIASDTHGKDIFGGKLKKISKRYIFNPNEKVSSFKRS